MHIFQFYTSKVNEVWNAIYLTDGVEVINEYAGCFTIECIDLIAKDKFFTGYYRMVN